MSMTSKQGLERLYSSGAPLIRTPMGQKKNGRIYEGIFYKKMYGGFCQAATKSCLNNEVAVRRGFTVLILGNNFSE